MGSMGSEVQNDLDGSQHGSEHEAGVEYEQTQAVDSLYFEAKNEDDEDERETKTEHEEPYENQAGTIYTQPVRTESPATI